MKKSLLFASVGMLILTGCSKEKDVFSITQNDINAAFVKANAEKVFGVTFDPNHDWNGTVNSQVTIQADPSVKKVQVLVNVCEVSDPETPSYVTRNALKVLTEAETNGQTSLTLSYDAPQDNEGLYVAYITDDNYFLKKVVDNKVSMGNTGRSRMTRGTLDTGYTLPTGTFAISQAIPSYAADRNWVAGEQLYELSDDDYRSLQMTSTVEPDYSDEFKEAFGAVVFSLFPNGRANKNLDKVKKSGYYNEKIYPITTGDEPIIVTPIYKCDHPAEYGNEVFLSDLYYYYYDANNMPVMSVKADTVAYFQSLPKFKAMPFNKIFGEVEDNKLYKHSSFALLYFGDSKTPSIGTIGSFTFPKGYKIGFMVRAKTTHDKNRKQGEVYGDGRLNNAINSATFLNFKSSELGEDGPRATWLTYDGKMIMSWESGTDSDFNDIMMQVEGGIEPIDRKPDPDPEIFTYVFEDTRNGDYDMNDVVITANRKDKTTVEYTLVACGAYKELYVLNINCGKITDNAEVHALFGTTPEHFVNTVATEKKIKCITVTKTVPESFSFKDPAYQPSIYDKATGDTIKLSTKGECPFGIMIPNEFKYPLERVCIKDAYTQFTDWGTHPILSTLWYTYPNTKLIYTK